MELLVGERFIEEKLPGDLKGLLPFVFFIFTISTLGLVNALSVLHQASSNYELIEKYSNKLEALKNRPPTEENLDSLVETMNLLNKVIGRDSC